MRGLEGLKTRTTPSPKNVDDYMLRVQTRVLKSVNLTKLDTDRVMFRVVDAAPLSPRFRVEMGFVFNGEPVLFSTMKAKDPDVVAKQLAEAYKQHVEV